MSGAAAGGVRSVAEKSGMRPKPPVRGPVTAPTYRLRSALNQTVGRMITGKQIRQARALMGLQRSKFAEKAGVPHVIVKLAEMTDDECPVTLDRARQIRRAIEAAGIELYGEGLEAGARRRAAPPC